MTCEVSKYLSVRTAVNTEEIMKVQVFTLSSLPGFNL